MEARSTSRRSWAVRRGRFVRGATTSSNCPRTRPEGAFEKKGGRIKASIAAPDLEKNLRQIVKDHTAGDPMREEVVWTYLSSTEIAERLQGMGDARGPRYRPPSAGRNWASTNAKPKRPKPWATPPFRNEQFEKIAQLKQHYLDSANPIISMDTKKKELLGAFFRAGRAWSDGVHAVFDHDFPSFCRRQDYPAWLVRPQTQRRPCHPRQQPRHQSICL